MLIEKKRAKDTLTGVELDVDETLEFTLLNREVRRLTVLETSAEVIDTTRAELKAKSPGAALRTKEKRHVTNIKFRCRLDVEGEQVELVR